MVDEEKEMTKIEGAQFSFRRANMKTMDLREIYNEYYGLERFVDKPIAGGFHGIETKYKPRQWRDTTKHGWKQSDQNFFSRVKRVCEALKKAGDFVGVLNFFFTQGEA